MDNQTVGLLIVSVPSAGIVYFLHESPIAGVEEVKFDLFQSPQRGLFISYTPSPPRTTCAPRVSVPSAGIVYFLLNPNFQFCSLI